MGSGPVVYSMKKEVALMKRIIDCRSSDFLSMTRQDLLDSIANCEGRTVCCETVRRSQRSE